MPTVKHGDVVAAIFLAFIEADHIRHFEEFLQGGAG
jgi:hypothetical protein